jgi:hypothetical protein
MRYVRHQEDYATGSVALMTVPTLVLAALLLAAVLSQAILTAFGRRHADKYCMANRGDAGVVDGDNAHCGVLSATTSTPAHAHSTIDASARN